MKKSNTWANEISKRPPHLKVLSRYPSPVKLDRWIKPVVKVVK